MQPSAANSSSLAVSQASRADKLKEISDQKFARAIHVPIDDSEVSNLLIRRNVPIDLPDEDAHDRRERLRSILASEALAANAPIPPPSAPLKPPAATPQIPAGDSEEYYTQGDAVLRQIRERIARQSLLTAATRIEREKAERNDEGDLRSIRIRSEEEALRDVRDTNLRASQRAEGRPLSAVALQGQFVATGSFSGDICLWDGESCELRQSITSVHDSRVSMLEMPAVGVLLKASADGTSALMRTKDGDELAVAHVYRGHEGRVSVVRMHPTVGDVIITGGHDGTLRVWADVVPVSVHASGHRQVTCAGFHPDGALLATSGSEGGVRLWDIRSGRAVLTMEKVHAGQALRVAFSGDGKYLATGGSDNALSVWDTRRQRCVKRIAAHTKMVSGLKFGGGVDHGDVLASASFDGTVKLWSVRRDFALIKAHTAHEDKVMAFDATRDMRTLISACYDRTWKAWSP